MIGKLIPATDKAQFELRFFDDRSIWVRLIREDVTRSGTNERLSAARVGDREVTPPLRSDDATTVWWECPMHYVDIGREFFAMYGDIGRAFYPQPWSRGIRPIIRTEALVRLHEEGDPSGCIYTPNLKSEEQIRAWCWVLLRNWSGFVWPQASERELLRLLQWQGFLLNRTRLRRILSADCPVGSFSFESRTGQAATTIYHHRAFKDSRAIIDGYLEMAAYFDGE